MHRLLYVCVHGLADEPIPALGDRTPLEAARTPVLDGLASAGMQGAVQSADPDAALESDAAVLAILGYDPLDGHPGRGVLEALGAGMELRDGDLAYRVNLAAGEGEEIADRRAGRDLSPEEAQQLADGVARSVRLPGASFELRPTVGHRGALVIRSSAGPLSGAVTNTDPAYGRRGRLGEALERFEPRVSAAEPLEDTDEARWAAELTNRFVEGAAAALARAEANERRRAAGRLPTTLLLTRDGGDRLPRLRPIKGRFGPEWGSLLEAPVDRGVAAALGIAALETPAATDRRERYAGWAALAAEALEGYDVVSVHLREADVAGHDGRPEEKLEVCEDLDHAFLAEVLSRVDLGRTVLAVTSVHPTSSIRGTHTTDSVPLLVAGPGVPTDATDAHGERVAPGGRLRTVQATEVVPGLVELLR